MDVGLKRELEQKVRSGERLSREDGIALYESDDLAWLGGLAHEVRTRKNGDVVHFNVNRHLKRFVDDPIAFRNLQARLAMLISGSNALQFLDSTFYPSSDLDLYVWKDNIKEVGHWLMEHEGYTFVPSVFQNDDFDKAHWMREQWGPSALRAALATASDVELDDVDEFHHQHYRFTGLHGVYSFAKNGPDGLLTVQVIAGTGGPLNTILTFHSSEC